MVRAKRKDKVNHCVDCGCVISKREKRCMACAGKQTSKRYSALFTNLLKRPL